ncbi:F-box protein [Quillaja saponaria]|uniref:F-box protein n=1 Tax=Quillaja saponaria TaxID=32244 RepID=A0AAD7PAV7_QUISA|nr:F-box protein [Quillaja saponaria]
MENKPHPAISEDIRDAAVVMESSHRIVRQQADYGKDVISNLPVEILSSIMCFLPTEDAVRTCVLSKKWISIWKSITNLHFEERFDSSWTMARQRFFSRFVTCVIHRLTNIQNFTLICKPEHDPSYVDAWITSILNNKLQKVHVHYLGGRSYFQYRHLLFDCDSLVELDLTMNFIFLKPHNSISLSNLKLLKLCGIAFGNDFHFNFPVLKVFEASDCRWFMNVRTVTINTPLLDSFSLLQHELSNNFVINICASCLTKFIYVGHMLEDFVISNPSSVRHASLHICIYGRYVNNRHNQLHKTGIRACKLLKQLSGVEYLELKRDEIEVLSHAKDFVANLPLLGKLVHLELWNDISDFTVLLNLLHKSPVLKSLVCYMEVLFNHDILDLIAFTLVPQCFLSHLKYVRFLAGDIDGGEHQLCLAKFVLENAKVLEKMTIQKSWRIPEMKMKKFKKQLLKCLKGSSNASVEFMSNYSKGDFQKLLGMNKKEDTPSVYCYFLCKTKRKMENKPNPASEDIGDAAVVMESSHRIKQQSADYGKDVISHLPVVTLSHILSFLPTDDAVRTCLLSKKWINIWTSITKLHFEDRFKYSSLTKARKQFFQKFVTSVIRRLSNSDIQSFTLKCISEHEPCHVNDWISSILSNKLQKLHVDYLGGDFDFPYPHPMFHCNSLIELDLTMDIFIGRPSSIISLPNLKILKLRRVVFCNDLHLNLPALKVFEATSFGWFNVLKLNINTPLLESFSVVQYQVSINHVIKISASHLMKFVYTGFLSEEFIINNLSSVRHASLHLFINGGTDNQLHVMGIRACKLLKQLHGMEYLELKHNEIEILSHAKDYVTNLPSFGKLVHLELRNDITNFEVLLNLLHKSPVLESLVCYNEVLPNQDLLELLDFTLVPQCFLSHLKYVRFFAGDIDGSEHQLGIAKVTNYLFLFLSEMAFSNSQNSVSTLPLQL